MEKGTIISHYTILEKLGEGGMGVVYKAHDTKLDRTVALKFLPPHLTQSEEDKQRFIREAKAAAALNHPHICTIHNVDEIDSNQFIVMEYVDGLTLRDKMNASPLTKGGLQGGLSVDQATNFALQISEALQQAHKKGIVHRDIKPENIMITEDNRIKVMDFGLAKLKGDKNLTKSGSTVGTMAYMSPEQIQGQEVDHRSDIFSFGVVLYEMLTGQTPFRGEHEAAMMYSIVNEEPQPVSKFIPDASSQLEYFLERTLEKDSSDRYQSMEDLLIELRRLKQKSSKKQKVMADVNVPDRTPEAGDDKKRRPLSRASVISISIAALVVIAGIASYLLFFVPGTPGYTDRVLVVPFENRTGDPSLDIVGRTASDWITEGILQSGIVEAVQTTTTLHLIGEGEMVGGGLEERSRLVELAGHTNAGIVVSGSFIEIGDDIRFETQIVDVQRDEVIYTLDPVRGPRNEPMEVINDLQQNILGVLSIHVYPGWDLQYFESPPVYEAYVEYMEGRRYFGLDYEKSIEHYERVLEIDPDFLRAIIDKGINYANMGQYAKADSIFQSVHTERDRLSPYNELWLDTIMHRIEGNLHKVFATLRQVESIAPIDPSVNYLVGLYALSLNRPHITIDTYTEFELPEHFIEEGLVWVLWWFGAFARAYHILEEHEKELEKAREGLDYFPEDLALKSHEVEALAALGEIEKVHNVIEESKAIDEPMRGSPGTVMLRAAYELRAHGNKEESIEIAEEAIEWYRANEPENKSRLANALYRAERWDEAYSIYEELGLEEPDNIGYKGMTGVLAVMMGDEEEARQVEEKLRNIDQEYLFGLHTYYRARINALLGEREKAVSLIEESFEQGRPFDIYIHRDLAFEPLQDYQPFQELLEPEG